MLGRKKSIKNSDWKNMHENVSKIISKAHIEELEAKTIKDIAEKTQGKKSAYAWSGGKDSIVLGEICKKAGIKASMMAICNLEYPEFINWIKKNKPEGLEIINTGQDIVWLSQNLHMLFPEDSRIHANWYKIVQHKAQRQYYKDKGLDIIILGRRKKDGNYVGKGDNIYTSNGVTRYSPLSEWSHEEISAYIHYNNLKLPPIYEWENGFVQGTHPWPARNRNGSIMETWYEVYQIDKSIVENASNYIESAKQFIESYR